MTKCNNPNCHCVDCRCGDNCTCEKCGPEHACACQDTCPCDNGADTKESAVQKD